MGANASGVRADGRGVSECKSGVPVLRSGFRAAQVEDEGAVSLGAGQAVRLSEDCERGNCGANAGVGAHRLLWYGRLGKDADSGAGDPGAADILERGDEYPVHIGNNRIAEGRATYPP